MILLPPRKVIIESPWQATNERSTEQHSAYLAHCKADCLRRWEAPFHSHGNYTDCLDDDDPTERALGIKAGWVWGEVADLVAVYIDLGISEGMRQSIKYYESIGKSIERRQIDAALVREINAM